MAVACAIGSTTVDYDLFVERLDGVHPLSGSLCVAAELDFPAGVAKRKKKRCKANDRQTRGEISHLRRADINSFFTKMDYNLRTATPRA